MSLPLENIIESVIFVSDHPVNVRHILEVLNKDREEEQKLKKKDVAQALEVLLLKYQADTFPFEVKQVAGGYQFFTKREYISFIRDSAILNNRRRLTRAAMETLAIIAYRQPVTKSEIEFIRGVNCDYAVQKLLEKKLIDIKGRSDAPGRPLIYATSDFFMQYFGINSVNDLPKLKEFEELAEDHMEKFRHSREEEENRPIEEELNETTQTQETAEENGQNL